MFKLSLHSPYYNFRCDLDTISLYMLFMDGTNVSSRQDRSSNSSDGSVSTITELTGIRFI